MFSMDLGSRRCGGYVVVALHGELDVTGAADVAAALVTVAWREPWIIADLAGLEFVDCGGLAALARGREHARHGGGDLVLAAMMSPARSDDPGTVVIWRNLDRVLPEKRPDGGWARRRLDSMGAKTAEHLGIVFHRYLEGTVGPGLVIRVNGQEVQPWNPFAPGESTRDELDPQRFGLNVGDVSGAVSLRRFVLPPRDEFSSHEEFERYSGPLNWNRQQGIYIYRADRLVQWGGWNGIRGIDEHTKLARASLDFDTEGYSGGCVEVQGDHG